MYHCPVVWCPSRFNFFPKLFSPINVFRTFGFQNINNVVDFHEQGRIHDWIIG